MMRQKTLRLTKWGILSQSHHKSQNGCKECPRKIEMTWWDQGWSSNRWMNSFGQCRIEILRPTLKHSRKRCTIYRLQARRNQESKKVLVCTRLNRKWINCKQTKAFLICVNLQMQVRQNFIQITVLLPDHFPKRILLLEKVNKIYKNHWDRFKSKTAQKMKA